MSSATAFFGPVTAASGKPLALAMQRLWLAGRVLPAGGRLTVQHVFRSAETNPIEVVYCFPLPRDAALRSFRITGEGFEVASDLKPTHEAVQTYERGIAEGALAALARQYGDGLVNLTVGNLRSGETVTVYLDLLAGVEPRDDGFRFRFPLTLAPSYHSTARVAATGGEAEIELPSEQFGDVILPPFRKDASTLHEVGFDLSIAGGSGVTEAGSPSHLTRIKRDGSGFRVSLATGNDVPDRDLVLDVRFNSEGAQVLGGALPDGKRTFAAIVPSTAFGASKAGPRHVAILLDRSGSMSGTPIDQARKAIEACLAVLDEADLFGLVAFDDKVEWMHSSLLPANSANRDKARKFLSRVDARGGTELAAGFLKAAKLVPEGGDVLILTDGQVFGGEEILEKARAANVRLSCLGIGSASQDRFLTLLARETGGESRFVTPRERVDLAAVDLFASLGRPVATGLKASANVQPAVRETVAAGIPVLLFGAADPGAANSADLTWNGGRLELPLPAGDASEAEAVRLLQGSRLITDWESRYPAEEATAPLERRKQSRVAARLIELSREYGLASRELSLVAVVKRAGDRPGELPETRVVPVGLPRDMQFERVFGAMPQAAASMSSFSPVVGSPITFEAARSNMRFMLASEAPEPSAPPRRRMKAMAQSAPPSPTSVDDELMDLAAQLEPDGGMPGKDFATRGVRSAAAVLAFVNAGHTLNSGAFRSHVRRLVSFLSSRLFAGREAELAGYVIEAAKAGSAPGGPWIGIAGSRDVSWTDIASAFGA